ncbi:MAG: carboxyltransferase domain-containing protein, partial [Bacteroidota bacterium]
DSRLACPRKSTPRAVVTAGSIGIGGAQTGIYSLDSPGGWHIIGRTPIKLFDISENPPMKVEIGTTFRFERITMKKFEVWGS